MHILILHNAVADHEVASDQDVLTQVAAVQIALHTLGHSCAVWGCDLNLAAVQQCLADSEADLVFNLVESLGGTDRLMHLVPALLEGFGRRFTGSSARALQETGDKLGAKARLRAAGLPTPAWLVTHDTATHAAYAPDRYLIKAIHEHASYGLDDSCLVSTARAGDLLEQIDRVERRLGRPCFAERYIDGREFNLSLLASSAGVEVLPVAEIEFVDYGPHKPRIVGYRAKWDEESPEYHRTPRRFGFPPSDDNLLEKLRQLAIACWRLWDLRGYARVDFRVDGEGTPWILEVNGNPCLSPDAGFAAAVAQAGMSFEQAVARIVDDATGDVGTSLS